MSPKPPKPDKTKNQHRLLADLERQGKLGADQKPLVKADSAGGIVYATIDGKLNFLLIQHAFNRHWSLPKGYVEPNESPKAGAIREVKEETGVDAEVVEFLGHIHIRTTHPDHRLHRKLHTYLMRLTGSPELDPALFDPKEGMIGHVAWFTPDEALRKIKYKNLHAIVEKAKQRTEELTHA